MIVVKQNNGTTFYDPNISTNGLIMYLDAANINSYVTSATAWNDLLQNYNTTLYNTPSYNSFNYGNIFFDGINEYLSLNNTLNLNTQTGFTVDMVNDNYIDFLGNIDGKWLINIRSFSIDIDVDNYISPIDGFKLNTPQIPFRVFA